MAKTVRVVLTDEEYEFCKRLAKYDKITTNREICNLLSLQIREEMELDRNFEKEAGHKLYE